MIPFHYGSGTVTNYGSGSDFLTSYGSGSSSIGQKVTVPTVPVPVTVPQHWPACTSGAAALLTASAASLRAARLAATPSAPLSGG